MPHNEGLSPSTVITNLYVNWADILTTEAVDHYVNGLITLWPAKCRVRDEVPNFKTEDM
jgi:hypothetical protein